ncbi:hypothetical protein EV186_1031157 [Labedaea rhizosphaerae]|uniref:Uncharacterized protein n=1 Tax=Labedaea rhizosphaerae TaxID=598644 RepID=A0A4R6SGD0_LABRH|nr:hypothetical protein EV186_1031157 [Labedaea rhizosphaerae]
MNYPAEHYNRLIDARGRVATTAPKFVTQRPRSGPLS